MNRIAALALASAAAIVLTGAATVFAQDSAETLNIKVACSDFALNPDTGALAGIDPVNNAVVLIPKAALDGKDAAIGEPKKVGKLPVSIVFKRVGDKSYFLVSCYLDSEIHVLDAKTLEPVKKIKTADGRLTYLTVSQSPADPYVYYIYGMENGTSLGRANLSTFQDEGNGVRAAMNTTSIRCLAISADGKFFYPYGEFSPSGFISVLHTVDADGREAWRTITSEHDSKGFYIPDGQGYYTAASQTVYTADLKTKVTPVKGVIECFVPGRPVIIARNEKKIIAMSTNTLKEFGSARMPIEFRDRDDGGIPTCMDTRYKFPELDSGLKECRNFKFNVRYIPDGAGKRLILAFGKTIATIPLKDMGVTDEPLLLAKLDLPDQATVGTPLTIKVQPYDPAVKWELKEGPEGMKVSGTTLVWTPKADQLGRTPFELKMSGAGIELGQVVNVNVVQPSVRLSFKPFGVALSPSGKLAVAWTYPGQPEAQYDRGDPKAEDRSQIALIDVATQKVLAEKKLLYSISTAAVDDEAVYVGLLRNDRIESLTLKDLSSDKRVNTDGTVKCLSLGAPKLLFALTQEGTSAFTTADLKQVDTSIRGTVQPATRMHLLAVSQCMPARCRGGWFIDGLVRSDDLSKILMIVDAKALPTLHDPRYQGPFNPFLWNRQATQLPQRDRAMGLGQPMDNYPAIATFFVPGYDKNTYRVEVKDLATSKIVMNIPLKDPRGTTENYWLSDVDGRHKPMFATAGKVIVACVRNEVFSITLEDQTIKDLGTMLEFEPLAAVPRISLKEPTKIAHKVVGGDGPYEFSLKDATEGITIDKADGTVTIYGAAVLKKVIEAVSTNGLGVPPVNNDPDAKEPELAPDKAAAELIKQYKAQATRLLGSEPAGIPYLIPLSVVVTDKKQRSAEMDYQTVLEVPEEMVIKELTDAIAEVQKKQAELRKQQDQWRQKDGMPIGRPTSRP